MLNKIEINKICVMALKKYIYICSVVMVTSLVYTFLRASDFVLFLIYKMQFYTRSCAATIWRKMSSHWFMTLYRASQRLDYRLLCKSFYLCRRWDAAKRKTAEPNWLFAISITQYTYTLLFYMAISISKTMCVCAQIVLKNGKNYDIRWLEFAARKY